MIHSSKAGSPETHGVEKPQPMQRTLDRTLEDRLPDRLATGQVGAAAEGGEDLIAEQPEGHGAAEPDHGVGEVVAGALARAGGLVA